jgi:hypothetical protein
LHPNSPHVLKEQTDKIKWVGLQAAHEDARERNKHGDVRLKLASLFFILAKVIKTNEL